jgi:hypothetical protein
MLASPTYSVKEIAKALDIVFRKASHSLPVLSSETRLNIFRINKLAVDLKLVPFTARTACRPAAFFTLRHL